MSDIQDDYVSCPYDPNHRVRRSMLAPHIAQCEWLNPELMACPYNVCHRYTQREMVNHVKICSSKPVPKDFVADFEASLPSSTNDDSQKNKAPREIYPPGDIDEARALAYPVRPGASPPLTYRPRSSLYVPRAYIPRTPRMSSMSLVRGHFLREDPNFPGAAPPDDEWDPPQ